MSEGEYQYQQWLCDQAGKPEAEDGMKWTREAPAKRGYYWFKCGSVGPDVIEVKYRKGEWQYYTGQYWCALTALTKMPDARFSDIPIEPPPQEERIETAQDVAYKGLQNARALIESIMSGKRIISDECIKADLESVCAGLDALEGHYPITDAPKST